MQYMKFLLIGIVIVVWGICCIFGYLDLGGRFRWNVLRIRIHTPQSRVAWRVHLTLLCGFWVPYLWSPSVLKMFSIGGGHFKQYRYTCIYICVTLCLCVHMYASMQACMHVRMYVPMYVCMYVCMYACMHACMHVCMFVGM